MIFQTGIPEKSEDVDGLSHEKEAEPRNEDALDRKLQDHVPDAGKDQADGDEPAFAFLGLLPDHQRQGEYGHGLDHVAQGVGPQVLGGQVGQGEEDENRSQDFFHGFQVQ